MLRAHVVVLTALVGECRAPSCDGVCTDREGGLPLLEWFFVAEGVATISSQPDIVPPADAVERADGERHLLRAIDAYALAVRPGRVISG